MESEVLKTISSSGLNGIKRIFLKKTFGKNCEKTLKTLIEKKEIVVKKKGNAFFVWTRENYESYILRDKSKNKMIENNVATSKSGNIENKKNTDLQNLIKLSLNTNPNIDFKMEFDKCLTEPITSLGWMPFSQIRKKICESKNISSHQFYNLASELVESHKENYEISSGGKEGILVRGLMHGFVRNV